MFSSRLMLHVIFWNRQFLPGSAGPQSQASPAFNTAHGLGNPTLASAPAEDDWGTMAMTTAGPSSAADASAFAADFDDFLGGQAAVKGKTRSNAC